MERAFDKAFEGLSQESKRQPNVRRDLALCIIRLFDEGESRPLRLSRMALATATIVTASDESVSSMEASLVETLLASRSSWVACSRLAYRPADHPRIGRASSWARTKLISTKATENRS
jgi:cytochrome P450